jgi:predicted kinase
MTKQQIFNSLPSRAVIILRGIPGAGKSTFVDSLAEHLGNPMTQDVQACSADDFFVEAETGNYVFNKHLIGQAHSQCFEDFKYWAAKRGSKRPLYVVVDNTNTTMKEMQRYIEDAYKNDWDIVIVTIHVDPEKAVERNIHGVPKDKIYQMLERLRIKLDPIPGVQYFELDNV